MRDFDYRIIPAVLMNHELMNLASAIQEYKGKQAQFIEAKPVVLQAMLEIAKIQSTGASNGRVRIIRLLKATKQGSWVTFSATGSEL